MRYQEVIRPPLWLMALYAFLFGSCVLAIWVSLDTRATVVSALISLVALIWIWIRTPLRIMVDDEVRIGRAHIEQRFIREVLVLDQEVMRQQRTRDADPAAFLALRFWSPRGVKIVIDDPRDPTPYWLVTTRKGEQLRHAIMN